MLFHGLDKLKRSAIMTTIILMFIGNILLVLPEGALTFLGGAVGFVLLVVSVVMILNFIGSPKALIHYIFLALGLFAGLMGIIFLVFEDFLADCLFWLVGLLPILGGAYGAYEVKDNGGRIWNFKRDSSIRAQVIYNPWMDSPQAVMQVIGGTMMYSAFLSVLRLIWIWPIHSAE